jgi:hypothetical protein
LPDPTPPALRLSPKFATNLKAAANGAGLDWATMLGILRARGATGHEPADGTTLRKLAWRPTVLPRATGHASSRTQATRASPTRLLLWRGTTARLASTDW